MKAQGILASCSHIVTASADFIPILAGSISNQGTCVEGFVEAIFSLQSFICKASAYYLWWMLRVFYGYTRSVVFKVYRSCRSCFLFYTGDLLESSYSRRAWSDLVRGWTAWWRQEAIPLNFRPVGTSRSGSLLLSCDYCVGIEPLMHQQSTFFNRVEVHTM